MDSKFFKSHGCSRQLKIKFSCSATVILILPPGDFIARIHTRISGQSGALLRVPDRLVV
jgi:hypothetical protein